MKKLSLIVIAFTSFQTFAQLNELKSASDAAKSQISSAKKAFDPLAFNKLTYVNPFVGTGGHGHTYPGASAPFGMMQLSPDSRHDGWDGCSGYHYSDSIIYGFSHTHLSGTGVSDYGDLLIVPQIGKPKIDPGYASKKGYQATFSHENEQASPGFYGVQLNDGDMNVRLTVSERAGFHEYTFNKENGKKFILIDLDHRDRLLSSSINILDKKTISGHRNSEAWATNQHFYFHLELDTPYQKARLFKKNGRNKLLLIFPKQTKRINIKVGMSHVSSKGARLNLREEMPDWNFETAKRRVENLWRVELEKIKFYAKDKEVMTNFYTSLYHSYLNPNVSNDVDGSYRYGDTIHLLKDNDYENYTVFSLWDTYRATHPLFTLTQVERTNAFINTFLRFYDYHGDLPVWELAGNETECMIGYHSVSVIADAYSKGIYDFDARKAIDAMIKTSTLDEYGKLEYVRDGFLGTGIEPESVSKTLEYAYDDFCIQQMLEQYYMDTDDRAYVSYFDDYSRRAMSFVNLYDPNTKFMRGRRSGQWHSPFDPAEVNFNYTEANSWQYSLFAPHAIGVLKDLMGGPDSLEMWLDRLFSTQMDLSGRHQADITGLIGQYAHGNEPSHHMAYLYNYTKAPEKTQFYIDKIQKEMYSNAPDGLSGNEDCGQMSSWYVLSALGLYQITPSVAKYNFGRPLSNQAMIELDNGKSLRINSNSTDKNKYIQKVIFNGKELKRHYITHDELMTGGLLRFVMGDKPNLDRSTYEEAPSWSVLAEGFVPAPFFDQENRIFDDHMTISLNVINKEDYQIFFTMDGSDPIESATRKEFKGPLEIIKGTTIKAYATNGKANSSVIENRFVKKNTNVSIEIKSEYDNQYASTGDFALIDGIRGGNEFRTGDWQGYWDQDLEFVVTFKTPTALKKAGIGLLSDMKSWVFYPENVEIIIEYENGDLESDTQILTPEVKKDQYAHHQNIVTEVESGRKVKRIIIKTKTTEKCPDWHLGAGNPTWTFVDEIFFE